MAKQRGKLVWGVTLLALGAIWLLREAGVFGMGRLATLTVATLLLALAGLCYAGFQSNPALRYGMLIPAGFLASLGAIALLFTLRARSEALLALVFFAGPTLAFARIYSLDRGRGWALFCAWGSAILGLTATLGAWNLLHGDLAGTVFLAGTGLLFVWHFVRSGRDWAILPGGILLTTSLLPLIDRLPIAEEFTASFALLGFAATFAALFLLGRPGSSGWARYPALALAGCGVLTFFVGFVQSVLIYTLPVALIAAGIYVIRGSLKADDGSNGPALTPPAP